MNLYRYSGPVMEFNRCVCNRWEDSTYAVSEKKARSNIIYHYKIAHNKTPNSKITLSGKIELVSEKGDE